MGDPSGIGAQIILKALSRLKTNANIVIIGDRFVFEKARQLCALAPTGAGTADLFVDLNNVRREKFKFGRLSKENGKASLEYIDKALELIKDKKIDCLVTCPVSKEAINKSGFAFSGHTEYLAEKSNTADFVMMLLNRKLKTVLLTRHLPVKRVSSHINSNRLLSTITITYKGLKKYFSIKSPRIVICGLNPHASDNGVIGSEENNIIKPAIKKLAKDFPGLTGPVSADIAITKTVRKQFDCCVAMYHDQALIALKLLGYNKGANITLGLPFVRTSPLHGTAFDIAATCKAKPDSLIEAIKLAIKCCQNQKRA